MKKAHTPTSYRNFISITYTLTGCLWLIGGILVLINTPFFRILSGTISLFAALCLFYSVFHKNREESDEMSEQNIANAGNDSLMIVVCLTIIVLCILEFLPASFLNHLDWKVVLASALDIIIGLLYFIKGILFIRLEDE